MKIHEKDIIGQIIYKEEQGKAKEQRMKEEQATTDKLRGQVQNALNVQTQQPFIDVLTSFKSEMKTMVSQ